MVGTHTYTQTQLYWLFPSLSPFHVRGMSPLFLPPGGAKPSVQLFLFSPNCIILALGNYLGSARRATRGCLPEVGRKKWWRFLLFSTPLSFICFCFCRAFIESLFLKCLRKKVAKDAEERMLFFRYVWEHGNVHLKYRWNSSQRTPKWIHKGRLSPDLQVKCSLLDHNPRFRFNVIKNIRRVWWYCRLFIFVWHIYASMHQIGQLECFLKTFHLLSKWLI